MIAPLGNLADGRSFAEVWYGKPFLTLRAAILARRPPAVCAACPDFVNRSVNDPPYVRPRELEAQFEAPIGHVDLPLDGACAGAGGVEVGGWALGFRPVTRVEIARQPAGAEPQTDWFRAFFTVDPWHYQPTRDVRRAADGRSLPVFAPRASGCRLWDQDGREYIDYVMGWGGTLLGYAEPRVQQAVRDALETAALVPFPHPLEMDVARMLERGVTTYNGVMLPSYAHDDAALSSTLTATGEALEVVAAACAREDLDLRLEIPPLLDL
ncbi:MAG: aminotransferase class III-fold pyridoxal phosphate-dependent enzyme [Planctomycetes bacterium]|nr:aminotransferase class III-fold pyridoxal phosphate-dependent enzyme [Planctomycetota bacterium]